MYIISCQYIHISYTICVHGRGLKRPGAVKQTHIWSRFTQESMDLICCYVSSPRKGGHRLWNFALAQIHKKIIMGNRVCGCWKMPICGAADIFTKHFHSS